MKGDELLEVMRHSRDISREQNPSGFGRDTEYFRIGHRVGKDALASAEVDVRLSTPQPSLNVGIEVGISLKSNFQMDLGLVWLEMVITVFHFRREGMLRLEKLKAMLLLSQVNPDGIRVPQYEGDYTVNIG